MHKPPFARTVLLALLSVSALPALADNAQRVHQTCSRYLDEQPDYYDYESRHARFSLRAMPQAAVKSSSVTAYEAAPSAAPAAQVTADLGSEGSYSIINSEKRMVNAGQTNLTK